MDYKAKLPVTILQRRRVVRITLFIQPLRQVMGIYTMVVELVWSRGAQQTKIEILVQKLQMIRKIQLSKLIRITKQNYL